MKIGIIGIGDIAKKAYLPIITHIDGIEPIICSRNLDVLKEVSSRYRIDYVQTIEELINKEIKAAFIHAATEVHYSMAKKLLENGIHLYVDKPLSYSLDETKELLEIAKEKTLILKVGFNRRYVPQISQLKKDGKPNTVILQKNRFNLPGKLREYVLDDFIHVIDTVLFLIGDYEDFSLSYNSKDGLISNISLNLYGKNCSALALMNRDSGLTEEKLEYFTSGEKIIIENLDGGYILKDNQSTIHRYSDWTPVLKRRGFYDIIDSFLNDIKNPSIYNEYDEILKTHELCEKIIKTIEGLEKIENRCFTIQHRKK